MERFIVFSDVLNRDGIGIKVYFDDLLVLEIFRDDAKKEKTITLFKPDIPLNKVEYYIDVFKKEIPSDFLE